MKLLRNKPEILSVPAIFIVVVLVWENLVNILEIDKIILPTPSEIGKALFNQLDNPLFWSNLRVTTQESAGHLSTHHQCC